MEYNPFSLNGKTILVTGSSSGLGKSIAIECSKMGATLIVTGRNNISLNETFSSLNGSKHIQITADLSNYDELVSLVDKCTQLDGFVNSAGIPKLTTVKFINQANLDEIVGINTIAPILLTSLLVKKKKIIPTFGV